MRVTLVSTDGPWLEAKVSAGGKVLTVMDEFSIDERSAPVPGSEVEVELSAIAEDSAWEDLFSGNPDRQCGIEQIGGWRYRAYGRVTSIHPVTVDCGLLEVPEVFYSNDPRVVGEFIAFTISRLNAALASEHPE